MKGISGLANDVDVDVDRLDSPTKPVEDMVDTIQAAVGTGVTDWKATERLSRTTVDKFGQLDVAASNAGILRDRDASPRSLCRTGGRRAVHLLGVSIPIRCAATHRQRRSKAGADHNVKFVSAVTEALPRAATNDSVPVPAERFRPAC